MRFYFLIVPIILSSTSVSAGLYRWVDDSGEIHFSDKVPVNTTNNVVSKINKHGITQKTVLYKPKKQHKEKVVSNKQVDIYDNDHDINQKPAMSKVDSDLLSTYETKEEITNTFIKKIRIMKGNAVFLDTQTNTLQKKLVKLEEQQKILANKKTKKLKLHNKILQLSETIDKYKKALTTNNQERVILSQKYKSDLERFIELTK